MGNHQQRRVGQGRGPLDPARLDHRPVVTVRGLPSLRHVTPACSSLRGVATPIVQGVVSRRPGIVKCLCEPGHRVGYRSFVYRQRGSLLEKKKKKKKKKVSCVDTLL